MHSIPELFDEDLAAHPWPRQIRVLLTVRQFAEKHPAFSYGALRNLIYYAEERKSSKGPIPGNGLAPAIVRVGRKVLLDEGKFFAWLDRQAGK